MILNVQRFLKTIFFLKYWIETITGKLNVLPLKCPLIRFKKKLKKYFFNLKKKIVNKIFWRPFVTKYILNNYFLLLKKYFIKKKQTSWRSQGIDFNVCACIPGCSTSHIFHFLFIFFLFKKNKQSKITVLSLN